MKWFLCFFMVSVAASLAWINRMERMSDDGYGMYRNRWTNKVYTWDSGRLITLDQLWREQEKQKYPGKAVKSYLLSTGDVVDVAADELSEFFAKIKLKGITAEEFHVTLTP